MEKEDPTEMGSPAPDVVKVITPEGEDHNINKEKLSDDEMVGTTIDTYEQSPEKEPDVHEEDRNIEPLSTEHLLCNELGQEEDNSTDNNLSDSENLINTTLAAEPEGEDHIIPTKEKLSDDEQSPEKEPDVHEEDKNIEPLSTEHLLYNELDLNSAATEIEIRVQEEDNSTDNNLSDSENLINTTLTAEPEGEDHIIPTKEKLSDDEQSPEKEPDVHEEDKNIEPLSTEDLLYNELDLNSAATEIEIRGQKEEDNSTDNNLSVSDSDNLINTTLAAEPGKDNEILENMKDKDRENSSEGKMEMEAHNHVQDQGSMQMKSKDVSPAICAEDIAAKNSLSEETGDKETDPKDNTCSKKEESLVVYGTREPNSASVLTKLVKVKGLYAVTNIFRRLSRRNDDDSNEKNKEIDSKKNIKEVNSDEREIPEVSQTKPGWSPLSLIIQTSQDKDQENKAGLKEASLESLESIAMKGRIVLYTRLWCQDCKEARLFLRKKRLRYSEINVDVYPGRKLELEKSTGSSDVPRVFFNQVHIGGLNELKALDESGKLEEKIEYVTSEGPSTKAPLPPFSGEDDVSSSGSVDELAVIVRKMKESIVVKDRFYKFRRITNCFLGSEAVDFLSEDQFLEREEAIEFGRKLARELFFRHVLEENTFEDGNHLYRFLDQDPVISQCQNIPRGIIQIKRQPLVQLSHRLRFLLYAILEAYISEDGRHVAYRTIHGSEEFARFLRIAEELQRVDLSRTAKEERLAFFINLYNLMAIHAILVWGHPEGALDRRKLLNEFKYVIGGCAYSLSDIYNGILRSNQRPPYTLIKPFGIYDKRFKVSLPYPEPLIHFALVSGNRSAPALRCYSPKNIDMELVEAAHDFLESGAFVLQLDSMTISVTKILKWYSVDFGKNQVEVLKHAANYLEVEKTRTLLELLDSTQLNVGKVQKLKNKSWEDKRCLFLILGCYSPRNINMELVEDLLQKWGIRTSFGLHDLKWLVCGMKNAVIVDQFYDKSNWCVIHEKTYS